MVAVVAAAMVFLIGVVGAAPKAAAQESRSVEWQRYDVTLQLRADGSYLVTERQEIEFRGGSFRTGFADIPITNVEGIGQVQVGEEVDGQLRPFELVSADDWDGKPGTYSYVVTADELKLDYAFTPAEDESRVFVIQYVVEGALRVYAENPPVEQIRWRAIDAEVTEVAPVRQASFTIVLPSPVPIDQVQIEGDVEGDPSQFSADGQTWVFPKEDMEAGDSLEVWMEFPAIVDVPPPSWQAREDAEAEQAHERQQRSDLLNLMFLAAGTLMAIAGGLGIYGLWHARGRDPHEGLVAEFLPEPPDDLPAGAAGALLDERVEEQDAVATLLDLAHRGVLKMEEVPGEGILGIGSGMDFKVTLLNASLATRELERDLLKALFPDQKGGTETKFSEVKLRFESHRDELARDIYAELVNCKYFTRSPEETRRAWQGGTRVALIVAIVAGIVACVALASQAGLIVVPVVVLIVLAFALYRLSGAMPRKTREGAEAAAKWRAFRRYLDDIERYEGVDEAKRIFDRYLPYAVAFGLERSWVQKFARVRTPVPHWYQEIPGGFGGEIFQPQWDPYPRRRRGGTVIVGGGGWGGWSGGSGGRSGGGDFDLDVPDLQDVSDQAGRSLQGSSDSLFRMLNTAASIFGAMASGGGGGSGGGFRGGGFGGGFGGGRRSGGGGGRGFG